MQSEIRFKPSFAAVFLTLRPGDRVVAEADAMASMGKSVQMKTRFNGGFFRALLRRFFGNESLFVNEFTCAEGQESAPLVLTQPTPGDIIELDLKGTSLFLQPGAFLACAATVTLGLGWAGFRSWFNGEGLFRLKVSGEGKVWVGAYGGISKRDVQGELKVDTGHLVAYEPTVRIQLALAGGIFSSFFGGEGFVSKMQGRGAIYIQSRSLDGLAAWTNAHII
ncbi:MAG: TIGR00266 family protein [Polyangiales bacterium]